jgi:hypothetical protein
LLETASPNSSIGNSPADSSEILAFRGPAEGGVLAELRQAHRYVRNGYADAADPRRALAKKNVQRCG